MKGFLLSDIGFFPFRLFLMLLLFLLKTGVSVILTRLLFRLPFTRKKSRYCLAAVIETGFAVGSVCMMNGIRFDENDYFSLLLTFVTCPLLFEISPKNLLKAEVGALAAEAGGVFKLLLLMLSGFATDDIYTYLSAFLPEFFSTLLFAAAVFGIYILITKKKRESSFADIINIPLFLLILLTLTIFAVSIVVLGVDYTKNVRQFILIFLNLPLFAVTVGYAMKIFIRAKNSEEKYKEILELQINHYKAIEKKNEELRLFRHDFPKIMRPLLMDIKQGNTKEAERLLEELNISVNASRPDFLTGNSALDTVLECARLSGAPNGITVTVGAGTVFPESGIDTRDIYTIFPNALDNALEACLNIGGNAEITFESRIASNAVYIKISNPCRMQNQTTGNALKSTKKETEKHGYGTKSIKKAASKYGTDNVSFASQNGVFTLSIRLDLPLES